MRSICRTVWGSGLQTAKHVGANHVIPDNGTLNQWVPTLNKFGMTIGPVGIQPRLTTGSVAAYSLQSYNTLTDTAGLKMQYLAIGNMGHKNYTAADQNSPPYTGPVPHMARHSGLYGQIPFVLCLPGNDLQPADRSKYRFRAWITVGGQQYIAYFLRLLTDEILTVEMKYVTVNGGVETEQTFVPTTNDLINPTKPGMPGAPIETTGDYLSTTCRLGINFSEVEIARLVEVSEILFGNPDQAIISEFALCTGVDKPCYHSWDGSTVNTGTQHPEAIGVQVSTFMTAYYPLLYANDGLEIGMNLGALEPLYGINVG